MKQSAQPLRQKGYKTSERNDSPSAGVRSFSAHKLPEVFRFVGGRGFVFTGSELSTRQCHLGLIAHYKERVIQVIIALICVHIAMGEVK